MNTMEITDMMYDLAEQLKNLRDEKKEAEQRVKDIILNSDRNPTNLCAIYSARLRLRP